MEYRTFGRTGHSSSVLVYGAASLWDCDQDVATESLDAALHSGINHFDTAASYGVSEARMGPWLPGVRDHIFLATKTTERAYDEAWAEINRSLELLGTDHVDLLQVHAVCDMAELDKVFADGCLKAFERARDEGMTRFLGITGHTEAAPSVHAEALRRFDFDAVLCPLNLQLWRDPVFRPGYEDLAALITERNVGLRTIKAVARRPYGDGEDRYTCWYKPFDQQRYATAAISWVLNGHPEVTGIATAGETTLLHQAVAAKALRMSVDEAEEILSEVDDYSTIFV